VASVRNEQPYIPRKGGSNAEVANSLGKLGVGKTEQRRYGHGPQAAGDRFASGTIRDRIRDQSAPPANPSILLGILVCHRDHRFGKYWDSAHETKLDLPKSGLLQKALEGVHRKMFARSCVPQRIKVVI
jgi:hypothetical protein